MRWEGQTIAAETAAASVEVDEQVPATGPAPALLPLAGLQRSVRTPEFAGITFHEVHAKSLLNHVPATSAMPFAWTINPYRGCSHACVYCFARKTHTYLDLDAGPDFDSQLVVKVNAVEVLHAEVRRRSWARPHVALGTNTDPYQRAEGRYRLMPGIIGELAGSGTPFSILTKGTLLARDLPLLTAAAKDVPVGVGISLAMVDPALQRRVEPGTPTPAARLDLIRRLADAGLPCGVMAMPILPWLTDSDEALDGLFGALAAAGASGVTAGALHLRPGAREWWFTWLAAEHPQLVGRYRRLYGGGTYATKEYTTWLAGRLRYFRRRHGLGSSARFFRDEPESAAVGTAPGGRRLLDYGPHELARREAASSSRTAASSAPAAEQPALF
ncbi:Rv2578c family radical SAM protein [Tersicoccus sp. Bi-70]|uniref:Rv2578c family radical SAM protein n=1 Tax=Tersicoccus sp. Bi-70 TaxID=1897634 RepID=UPI0009F87B99|nr:Rv2578c family radical SAM protein [Tersicoccus sp. Bi-70]